jgi:hypothetical protein
VYSADGCVTRTESHSWQRAAPPWPLLMRLARSQPELPGKRLFPAAVAWAPRTCLEPALPAILIHKDEGASGNVTGPGAMAAGKAGSQPAGQILILMAANTPAGQPLQLR